MSISFGFAYEIMSFSDYQKELGSLITSNKPIPTEKIEQRYENIKDNECEIEELDEDNILVSPTCLVKDKIEYNLDLKEVIDHIWPYVDEFKKVYDLSNTEFSYEPTKPILNPSIWDYRQDKGRLEWKTVITYMISNEQKLALPKRLIAQDIIKNYSFYAVRKDFAGLPECTLQNYKVALNRTDGLYMTPGSLFNMNENIRYAPGYCKGSWPQNLMFYGGVCGMSTHLFRTSLLIPEIDVTQRINHSKRWVKYYGNYIFGDDAAMYEMGKQFEIQNNGKHPVYFRALDKWTYNYFVGILPYKNTRGVTISKEQIWTKSAQVNKKIYDIKTKKLKNIIQYDSYYTHKYYGN